MQTVSKRAIGVADRMANLLATLGQKKFHAHIQDIAHNDSNAVIRRTARRFLKELQRP
jgi:hypothetical protein